MTLLVFLLVIGMLVGGILVASAGYPVEGIAMTVPFFILFAAAFSAFIG